jgi:DNA-binding PadR family transcriptional regulator
MPRRKTPRHTLTELEGAALSVIHAFGPSTPYRVRREFLISRSREWSGSAGAVYPALQRLHRAGLLLTRDTNDRRRSVLYSLSPSGARAFADWLCDVERAAGSGLDPFRCRADHWATLPKARRKAFERDMVRVLNEKCERLARHLRSRTEPEPIATALEIGLHKARLRWLGRGPV